MTNVTVLRRRWGGRARVACGCGACGLESGTRSGQVGGDEAPLPRCGTTAPTCPRARRTLVAAPTMDWGRLAAARLRQCRTTLGHCRSAPGDAVPPFNDSRRLQTGETDSER